MLEGLQPPMLADEGVPYVKAAKYFGVWFGQKFTWNTHIQKTTIKATIVLGKCRRPCGRNWDCSPKMSLKLHITVIRPMITYGRDEIDVHPGFGSCYLTMYLNFAVFNIHYNTRTKHLPHH